MNKLLTHVVWLFCMLSPVCICTSTRGQSLPADATDPAQTIAAVETSVPREVLPAITYIYDQNGELIPWVDFPFSEYDKFANLERGKVDAKCVVAELSMEAVALSNHVQLKTKLNIHILADGRQVIPIAMGKSFFKSQPKSSGKPAFVRLNPEYGGYELLVDAKKDEDLEIEFTTLVPLNQIGAETHLRLAVPRVSVSSLSITIPEVDIALSAGEDLSVDRFVEDDGTSTKFLISGVPSAIDLFWHPVSQSVAAAKTTFEVSGEIEVLVDALGGISSDAILDLTSFGQPIKEVTVKLPRHTRWSDTEAEFASYRITPQLTDGDRQEVLVVFKEANPKPSAIRLRVRADKELSEFELAGFDVAGASNQSGTVSLYSEETRSLSWTLGEFALQTSSPDSSRRVKATFQYVRPDQIRLTIAPQTTELVVEPLYRVVIEETRARLTAIYQCSKRGGSPASLKFDLSPWRFQSLGPDPDNVVRDADTVTERNNGRLEIPLEDPPDRFEVSFEATLTLEDSIKIRPGRPQDDEPVPTDTAYRVDLDLPAPLNANLLVQSTLAVSGTSNVVVRSGESKDYAEISLPERLRVDMEAGFNPLCFRMKPVGPPTTFPIIAVTHKSSTTVDCDIEIIDVDSNTITVRQDMKWRVSDVALQYALLTMDADIFDKDKGDLRVSVDDKSVIYSRSPTLDDFFTGTVTVLVPLEPNLENFEMTVTYKWSEWNEKTGEPSDLGVFAREPIDLDLVVPKKSTSVAQDLMVRTQLRRTRLAEYEFTLDSGRNAGLDAPWTDSRDIANPDPDIEAFFESDEKTSPMVVLLEKERVEADAAAANFEELVEQAWFQTWYTHTMRTDRAVFRVQGGDAAVRITMPEEFSKLNVLVDGEPGEYRTSDGDTTLEVALDAAAASHVIELQYSRDTREPPGVLKTELPGIEGADIFGQWYWHIVMPRNECLVTWPRSLTRAHEWDWSVLIPRRKPQLSLSELEVWSGAKRTHAKVLAGSSEYLFGAMGETKQLSVRTTLLPIYVLVVAGGILVFGLLLIYSQRRMLVLFLVAMLIAGLVFLHPSYAAIAGQVAVFGILLVAAANFLLWLVRQPGRPSTLLHPSSDRGDFAQLRKQRPSIAEQVTELLTGSSRIRSDE